MLRVSVIWDAETVRVPSLPSLSVSPAIGAAHSLHLAPTTIVIDDQQAVDDTDDQLDVIMRQVLALHQQACGSGNVHEPLQPIVRWHLCLGPDVMNHKTQLRLLHRMSSIKTASAAGQAQLLALERLLELCSGSLSDDVHDLVLISNAPLLRTALRLVSRNTVFRHVWHMCHDAYANDAPDIKVVPWQVVLQQQRSKPALPAPRLAVPSRPLPSIDWSHLCTEVGNEDEAAPDVLESPGSPEALGALRVPASHEAHGARRDYRSRAPPHSPPLDDEYKTGLLTAHEHTSDQQHQYQHQQLQHHHQRHGRQHWHGQRPAHPLSAMHIYHFEQHPADRVIHCIYTIVTTSPSDGSSVSLMTLHSNPASTHNEALTLARDGFQMHHKSIHSTSFAEPCMVLDNMLSNLHLPPMTYVVHEQVHHPMSSSSGPEVSWHCASAPGFLTSVFPHHKKTTAAYWSSRGMSKREAKSALARRIMHVLMGPSRRRLRS